MKRKMWLLNLILALIICTLLACSYIHKLRTPELNMDILTPEIEVPPGGEIINEQEDASKEDASTETDAGGTRDTEEGSTGSDSEDIVTPEF